VSNPAALPYERRKGKSYSLFAVIGEWPKPVFLPIPDWHRAAREGRIYIPTELNAFVLHLKKEVDGE